MCDEVKLAKNVIDKFITNGTIIDVGAFSGGTSKPFVNNGWMSYCFEPNPERYQFIESFLESNPNKKNKLILEKCCVGDENKDNLTFYLSDVSKGISSLTPFHESHQEASFVVSCIRLEDYIQSNNIETVNFLKIDTEGHDLYVLKGFPWNTHRPEAIVCEFEDLKTNNLNLNYTWKDMANFLSDLGYKIIVSEWYPIVRYGTTHNWRCFKEYPCELDDENAWGNFICFKDDALLEDFKKQNMTEN
jgi:FkbM family methyltransferase